MESSDASDPANWTEGSLGEAGAVPGAVPGASAGAALVGLYGLVLGVGVLGNTAIVAAILAQPGARTRSLLLLNLCFSDLLVCAVAAPVSAVAVASPAWTLGLEICRVAFFFQALPVAASTLSLMMLSLDRYAAVKHPRVLARAKGLNTQSGLPAIMVCLVWLGAAAVNAPVILVRSVRGGTCEEHWESPGLRTGYALSHIGLVYLGPCLTVAGCHWAVGHKLCAAANSPTPEITIQPPPTRRPKQVIIVADGQSKVLARQSPGEGDSDDDDAHEQIRADLAERQRRPRKNRDRGPRAPRVRRASRSERAIVRANRRLRRPPLVKQASRQSLQSRRRLAKLLVALGVVFATCWLPYVVVRVVLELGPSSAPALRGLLPFVLLLGHTHSAINPVVYWLLNRQTLRWPALSARCANCTCCGCSCPGKGFSFRWWWNRGRDARLQDWNPRASSTNEAALGPFHPKYNIPRDPQLFNRPRASSVFN